MTSVWKTSVLLLFLLFTSFSYGQNITIQAGMSLEEALQEFQRKGYNILYSSDLIRPELKITTTPASTAPRKMLEDLLYPFALTIQDGPAETLLIVRDLSRSANTRDGSEMASPKRIIENIIVPFVTIYLTAQDRDNHFVTDLKADDLMLLEDGKMQAIKDFVNFADIRTTGPIRPNFTICLLLDSSQSMQTPHAGKKRYELVRPAALELIKHLQPGDRVMVIGFNQASWIIHEPTDDVGRVSETLQSYSVTKGHTAIYDAVYRAHEEMKKIEGRKIIVLFSDGKDNASKLKIEELLQSLKSTDSTIVVVGTTFPGSSEESSRAIMESISEVTGGHAFFSNGSSDFTPLIQKVEMMIRSQYAAGYTPPDPSIRKWRQVQLKCKVPGIQLRYRSAYLY